MVLRFALAAAVSISVATPVFSKDLGTIGQSYEIIEPNLLEVIYARLHELEAQGEFGRWQEEMEQTTRNYVNRPTPVLGLLKAETPNQFEVDLSITLSRDLMDHTGRVFAKAGTVINPLHFSHYNQRIIVFDGDDPEQVEFAIAQGDEVNSLLVLVSGEPLTLMREHQRRFYFDQQGQIVERFQLSRVPSVIERGVDRMIVTEVVVGGSK